MESKKKQSLLRNQKGMVDTREMMIALGTILIICIVVILGSISFSEKDPESTVLEDTTVQEEDIRDHSSGLFNIQNSEINIGSITVNGQIEEPPVETTKQESVVLEEVSKSDFETEDQTSKGVILIGVLFSILGACAILYTFLTHKNKIESIYGRG